MGTSSSVPTHPGDEDIDDQDTDMDIIAANARLAAGRGDDTRSIAYL